MLSGYRLSHGIAYYVTRQTKRSLPFSASRPVDRHGGGGGGGGGFLHRSARLMYRYWAKASSKQAPYVRRQ